MKLTSSPSVGQAATKFWSISVGPSLVNDSVLVPAIPRSPVYCGSPRTAQLLEASTVQPHPQQSSHSFSHAPQGLKYCTSVVSWVNAMIPGAYRETKNLSSAKAWGAVSVGVEQWGWSTIKMYCNGKGGRFFLFPLGLPSPLRDKTRCTAEQQVVNYTAELSVSNAWHLWELYLPFQNEEVKAETSVAKGILVRATGHAERLV